jgi:hypothetical protein
MESKAEYEHKKTNISKERHSTQTTYLKEESGRIQNHMKRLKIQILKP